MSSSMSSQPPPPPPKLESSSSPTGAKTCSIPQACEKAGVSRRTIYNWILKGHLEIIRTAGGAIRIYEDSLWKNDTKYDSQESV